MLEFILIAGVVAGVAGMVLIVGCACRVAGAADDWAERMAEAEVVGPIPGGNESSGVGNRAFDRDNRCVVPVLCDECSALGSEMCAGCGEWFADRGLVPVTLPTDGE